MQDINLIRILQGEGLLQAFFLINVEKKDTDIIKDNLIFKAIQKKLFKIFILLLLHSIVLKFAQ